MRNEQIITANNNQMEEKGMKSRLLHFKNHHYYLWIFYHLHSVFRILKDPDYCAARCDCLFHYGRKQNGKSYDGYLLQIFPVMCV